MSKIQFCPRCGQRTDAPVCPICFTRLDEPQVQQPQMPQRRELTPEEMQQLPPFECPRCHANRLLTDGSRYYCAVCGVAFTAPQPQVDPVTENPDFIQNPADAQPKTDPQQTVDFTPPPSQPPQTPVKEKKRDLTRGGLIGILCGIVALFTIGVCIAVAANGIEKKENTWQNIIEDPYSGFGEDFFNDIPGFEDYFSSSRPQQDEPDDSFAEPDEYDWKTGEAIPDGEYYPNGCSEQEYTSLKDGMTYAQLSAIIGGDAGNWYETTDQGEDCMVFQWITEDSRGVVSVKMVDGKAKEFHVEEY